MANLVSSSAVLLVELFPSMSSNALRPRTSASLMDVVDAAESDSSSSSESSSTNSGSTKSLSTEAIALIAVGSVAVVAVAALR